MPLEVAEDVTFITFYSELADGQNGLIKIEISQLGDPHLPNVCNLAFGTLLSNGEINDTALINHQNKDKVFSTILLFSLVYLQSYPQKTIGVDGSNDVRAYLYHRMFLTNRQYLNEYFIAIGVD
jgi:hypothetical protein